MRFDVFTVFPEAFDSYLATSILKRARKRRLISIALHGLRKWGRGRRRQLDDKPYGGGAGMVLAAEPILKGVDSVLKRGLKHDLKRGRSTGRPERSESKSEYFYDRKNTRENDLRDHLRGGRTKIVVLSAKGKQFTQKTASEWAKRYQRLVLISGRYEGIDERVRRILKAEEISIGPYVLTDGDAAAMVIVSAVSRLIPGVIRLESLAEESHWNLLIKREAAAAGTGLEYPHYTRPAVVRWRGKRYAVPSVLLSGDHRAIQAWRARHGR